MRYLLAHDVGTSGDKAVLYSEEGRLIASELVCYPLDSRPGGIAEQNSDDWWHAVVKSTRALLERAHELGIEPREVASVSFSGQMMGCICVDKNGALLRPALIWADMRASEEEAELREKIDPREYYRITGHRLSSAYAAFKLMWVKKHQPELYAKTYKTLCAKDYIIYKLTGRFVTDFSDASGTGVWDLRSAKWSQRLIGLCGLDADKFPEALSSYEIAGEVTAAVSGETGLAPGTPVVCGGGDGPCAAVGTGCVTDGDANSCLGTSSWLSVTTSEPLDDPDMCSVTWPHLVPGKFMPCGAMQCGGGSYSWATELLSRDLIEAFPDDLRSVYRREDEFAASVAPGSRGLIWLPYLLGERSPRWNPRSRGAFIGLTYGHTRAELLRAVMEGVAFNLELVLCSMRAAGCKFDKLVLVGGGAKSAVWRQIMADIYKIPIIKPVITGEATSAGAAIAGGVGAGVFADFSAAARFVQPETQTMPNPENFECYDRIKPLFERCYRALEPIFDEL